MSVTSCPQCSLENVYADGALWICADCGHEWTAGEAAESTLVVRDSNGNVLRVPVWSTFSGGRPTPIASAN